MGFLLKRLLIVPVLSLLSQAALAELSDRHELGITLESTVVDSRSNLGAWPDAGYGKLRYDEATPDIGSTRVAIEYRAQMAPTLFARLVVEATDEPELDAGATEAWLEWRPLPQGPLRHRLRAGAFYPGFSIENADAAWDSPYTLSFSSINAWLAEEIRPFGIDWQLSRNLGPPASPQELGASAGLFYGNDPAGTLLFWRGWSLHGRQTRLNERLPLPALVLAESADSPGGIVERHLDPFAEIDDRPGFYAGTEWRYAHRASVSLAFYDNRADPYSFRDGQWAWGTRFWHLGTRISLPGDVALLAQSLHGDTDWLIRPTADGSLSPEMALVTDEFSSAFILLSKTIRERHRVSVRLDRFDFSRAGALDIDSGRARTLAYTFAFNSDLDLEIEWLEIASTRDLWPMFYGQSERKRNESMLTVGLRLTLFDSMS